MQCAHYGKQQQGGCCQVAGKEDGEGGKTNHQHRLAGEGVDEIAAEGAEQQCRNGIARQHETYHVLRGTKMLAQIERQQWCEYVEGEEEGEIGHHHLAVVAVPESLVGHGAICRK